MVFAVNQRRFKQVNYSIIRHILHASPGEHKITVIIDIGLSDAIKRIKSFFKIKLYVIIGPDRILRSDKYQQAPFFIDTPIDHANRHNGYLVLLVIKL